MEVLGAGAGQSAGKVWIENHPTQGWAPGVVDSVGAGGCYVVVDERGEQFDVPQDKARPVDQACLKGVNDLLALGDFNEGALLHNVRVRYLRDEIYTGIGEPILISVNPFQNLPGLYSEQKQKYYRERAATRGGADLEMPRHLFSVAAAAHTTMLDDAKNQSIIISGESGAGKTEATKRILAYFANLQRTGATGTSASGGGGMSIEDQVLRSNPILEAFGNAKTIRNDNSSRFGKFIDIEFDIGGKLRSARISNYLLEKVRIVKQQPHERGYHAFYQLCAGAATMGLNSMLNLQDASQHAYTSCCTEINGIDDVSSFQEMVECMDSLGFTTEEKNSVFKVAAAVLHLGDLAFEAHGSGHDGCRIRDASKAAQISELLHIDIADFRKVFQYKTLEDPFTKKIIDMPQDEMGSSNTRHSMAKTAYSRLFDWLVWRINQSTMSKGASGGKAHNIGILDIYGFEVFDWNSFEQLCINFANEKLQQHFNSHMFTLEQQLYTEEGISWSHISFQDNREIIDTLERKPLGLFCIVDSECLMPNATDPTCLNKIYNSFKNSRIVYKPSRFASTEFAVAHYAGEVTYDIISFLEKNTDKLHADIINLLKSSGMPLLRSLFSDPRFAPEMAAQTAAAGSGRRPAAPTKSPGADSQRAKQNVTVSMMFRQQLDQLVEDLNKTNPRYIRCIKPNPNKQAHEFDSLDVQRQLRCAGMLESIRIRRAGYSVRRPFKEFFNRFRVLCPNIAPSTRVEPDFKELSRRLLLEMETRFQREREPLEAKSWQIGRSKVFLKEELQSRLDKAIAEALKGYVILMQKRWRGCKARRHFQEVRAAAALVQAGLRALRAVLVRNELRAKRDALRKQALQIQRRWRGHRQRKLYKAMREAAILLQAGLRTVQAVARLADRRIEARVAQALPSAEPVLITASPVAAPPAPAATEALAGGAAAERSVSFERLRAELPLLAGATVGPGGSPSCRPDPLEQLRNELASRGLEVPVAQYGNASRSDSMEQLRRELASRLGDIPAVAQVANDSNGSKPDAMEQLRNELATMMEGKPRPAFPPEDGEGAAGVPAETGRKTLLNQRALFEQLKQQFQNATGPQAPEPALGEEIRLDTASQKRELELEEEVRRLRRENVELSIRLESLQDEVRDKHGEASKLLQNSSVVQAELQDVKLQLEHESFSAKRQASDFADMQARVSAAEAEAGALRRRVGAAEDAATRAEEDARAAALRTRRLEEEMAAFERRVLELQAQASDALAQKQALISQLEDQRALVEHCKTAAVQAERSKLEVESNLRWLESESERLKAELQEATEEGGKLRRELLRAEQENRGEELKRELEKQRARATYFEREYNNSKQLNNEMTEVMSQMTQAVAERSDEKSDVANQNRMLQKQLEAKGQDLRTAKLERDEVQKQLDALQSTGNYYQERYRDAQEELRNLRHEHSISAATASKLKLRVECLQKEAEDLKAQCAKLNFEVRTNVGDSAKIERYERHVKELESKMQLQDEELDRSQAFAAKSQAVNDCLNTLLVLESEQTSLYESAFPVEDEALLSQFDARKSKAQKVIGRLNDLIGLQYQDSKRLSLQGLQSG